jgi:hypothetical protein
MSFGKTHRPHTVFDEISILVAVSSNTVWGLWVLPNHITQPTLFVFLALVCLLCLFLRYLVLSYITLSCSLRKTASLELLAFVSSYACLLQATHHKDIKQGNILSYLVFSFIT